MYVRKVDNRICWLQSILFVIMFIFTSVDLIIYFDRNAHSSISIEHISPTKLVEADTFKHQGAYELWVDYSPMDTDEYP